MRFLTLFPGTEFVIGSDIRVRLIDVNGGRVRLGFSAPAGVSIDRQEIYDQIQRLGRSKTREESPPQVPCSSSPTIVDIAASVGNR